MPARWAPFARRSNGSGGWAPGSRAKAGPGRAQTKDKGERVVSYVTHHFFVRYRDCESWAHLNQLAEQWRRGEVDPRRRGTV